jgi:hypothetical protein
MEPVSYTAGIIWYSIWPVLIYVSYKFVALNIEHFEKHIK